ncbi:MAG: PilZ domain-containing protein [Candidatus Zixiibacteriota bacterium]|nr:MAG: PilZ domain-containing protein [candidate division Zixibacteria bacterium]
MKNRVGAKNDNLALWDRLILTLKKDDGKSEFISRVENIKRSSYVFEMPVRQSGKCNLQKGDVLEVRYNRRDAAYTFKASIKDLFINDTGSIEVKRECETRREQRRKYVRLNISESINFRILESPENKDIGLSPEFQGSLLNISAGGFLFETDKKVPSDSLLIIKFELKNHYSLENILAIVKRSEQTDDGLSLVGSEFITRNNKADFGLEKLDEYLPPGTGTFDENLQRLIVRFIYSQQVKMRKEGKL